jgi:hypothetical protein
VEPENIVARGRIDLRIVPGIDGALNLDVRHSFLLQGSLLRLLRIMLGQGTVDVPRMCVVAFYEI